MIVLGLNAAHDASACLLIDGRIHVAISEERLSRRKHHEGYPDQAIAYCLDSAGLAGMDSIDAIVINEYSATDYTADIRRSGYEGQLITNPSHHLLHAYYALAASGWTDTAIMVVDGSGYSYAEYNRRGSPLLGPPPLHPDMEEAESFYIVRGGTIELVEKRWGLWDASRPYYRFPSLGHLFSMASQYIFGHMNHAGKTMGLAPFGDASSLPDPIVTCTASGIDVRTDWILELPPRSDVPAHLDPVCRDLAAKVQDELEVAMLHLAGLLHRWTQANHLCISGGVALNSVANGRLLREGPYSKLFVTPAAGDSGVAVGAALYGFESLTGSLPQWSKYDDFHGRIYHDDEVDAALLEQASMVHWDTPDDPAARAAVDMADGLVIGWFEGRSEFGPRALGHRSIVCDPRGNRIRDHINRDIKYREPFRPYAASVLGEHASTIFDLPWEDPFMLTVTTVEPAVREDFGSVCHIDGTCRVQTVTADTGGGYHRLIEEFFAKTGVPLVLNTSFNIRGEPVVESPGDAIRCFLGCELDVLYLQGRRTSKVRISAVDDPGLLTPVIIGAMDINVTREVLDYGWGPPTNQARTLTGYRISLSSEEATVLDMIDGRRRVEDLVGIDSDISADDMLSHLSDLQAKGLIAFRWPDDGVGKP